MKFPLILKTLRQEKCLTHKQLACKIGYSKAIIGFWESGKTDPSLDALIKLSDFFDVSIDFLAGKEDDNKTKGNNNSKFNNNNNSFNFENSFNGKNFL